MIIIFFFLFFNNSILAGFNEHPSEIFINAIIFNQYYEYYRKTKR